MGKGVCGVGWGAWHGGGKRERKEVLIHHSRLAAVLPNAAHLTPHPTPQQGKQKSNLWLHTHWLLVIENFCLPV